MSKMFFGAKAAILVLLILFVDFRSTSAWRRRRRRSCSARDCSVSSWSYWSSCNAYTCGQQGSQSRSRSVRSNAYCGRSSCPSNLYETRQCYGSSSRNCALSSWSEWSVCTATKCGASGTQRSTRHRITTEACGGWCTSTFRKTRTCYNRRPVDCEVSSWSEWSACTASVCDTGTGIQVSSRHKTTTETCGGTCTSALQKTRSCSPTRKATECQVSPWSQWGSCISTTCELSGFQKSTRYKEVIEECKGTCTFTLYRTRVCHLASLPCLNGGTSDQALGCNCMQGFSGRCCEKGPPTNEGNTHSSKATLEVKLGIPVGGFFTLVLIGWIIKCCCCPSRVHPG
ncbi:spondin-1-like [Montipora capricornis]|uniref:spondin-1-like n=1 Tax=Montipora capricornis TaxID=246305 RepID=UPI0035F2088C